MRVTFAALSLLFLGLLRGSEYRVPARSDPGGVLPQLNFAAFMGSGSTSIQAMAVDGSGNVYVAGTTTSSDFQTRNAAQPKFGEATILRTTDLGVTWTHVGSPPDPSLNIVVPDPVSSAILYAGAYTGIYKTTDGGQSWQLLYPFTSGYSFDGSLVVDPGNHLRVAAISPFSGAVIHSVDGGETWSGGTACEIANCGGQLFADPGGSGTLLLVSLGLYVSHDWGSTFQALAPPGGSALTVAFDPSHPGWIYAATGQGVMGTLSLSTDSGATWVTKASPRTTFSAIENLAVDPNQPSTLIATTADGLYKSSDGAGSWTLQGVAAATFQPEGTFPFVILSHSCTPAGGLAAIGSGPGFFDVAFSPDYGTTWTAPHVSRATSVTTGAGCTIYATRTGTSDAFVAKLAPDGATLWATYLGGSDQDEPVGLAVDAQGNAYVTGDTLSLDFPVTLLPIGVTGKSSVFVTKYTSDGRVDFSVLVGGEAMNQASVVALNPSGQNVYVGGNTTSQKFPVTSGALFPAIAGNSSAGFLAELSSAGALLAASYLGASDSALGTMLIDPSGNLIVAGAGAAPGLQAPTNGYPAFLAKLDPAISRVLSSIYLPNSTFETPSGLATDPQGNLLVYGAGTGVQASSGAYTSPASQSTCGMNFYQNASGVAYLMKLSAANWAPVYTAVLQTPCGIQPGGVTVDSTGDPVLAMASGGGLPLHNPLLAGPTCAVNSSAVAKLSPDGSSLVFATYLDACDIPAIAAAPDGVLFAGVGPSKPANQAGVLRLKASAPPAISLDGIANAFSGDASAIVGGGLYSLTASGFQLPAIDLGLNPAQDLPFTLGAVQVTIDGVPAPILQTGSGRVMVVTPPLPGGRLYSSERGFRLVQLFANGVPSNAVWMPESASLPGVLTADFPNLPGNQAEGVVRNEDGSVNGPANPASVGSTVTVFVTGMGATNAAVVPGSIAHSEGVVPKTAIYSSWETATPDLSASPEVVNSIPGFVSAMFQVHAQVPSGLNGTAAGIGVQEVFLGFEFFVDYEPVPPISNVVGVYVK